VKEAPHETRVVDPPKLPVHQNRPSHSRPDRASLTRRPRVW
jgi:hypothetical protein